MTAFVGLLRAINVGGAGKLVMSELNAICQAAGFTDVRTYIASGNVVFDSGLSEARVKDRLERALTAHAGKPVSVLVRNVAEMQAILADNPFKEAAPNRVIVLFLDRPPAGDALSAASGRDDEELALGRREIYVHYPKGMGRSKLNLAAGKTGTGRNLNTVAKLAAMAAG